MADVDVFDLESDLPKFLESFLQKAETVWQDVEEQNLDAEVLAEVVDQTISLIQTLQEPGEIQPSDIIALNSLAGTFTNVLALLWNHISLLKGSQRQTCMDSQCGFCGCVTLSNAFKLHFCSYKHVFQRFTSFVGYDQRSSKNCFHQQRLQFAINVFLRSCTAG